MKLTLLFLSIIICTVGCTPDIRLIKGVIWQPTLDYNTPIGSWDKIGADTILVQWTLLEKKAWLGALTHPEWTPSPDWSQIVSQPWAKEIIFGLSGDFNMLKARKESAYHMSTSLDLSNSIKKLKISNKIRGWYAPIEIDPSWSNTEEIVKYLEGIPEPLYVSSFVGKFEDPKKYAKWVAKWLPKNRNLLFQDSVGTRALNQRESLLYTNALVDELGHNRVNVILEAFDISKENKINSGALLSLAERLIDYKRLNIPVYIFSCRYLTRWDVLFLKTYGLAHTF